MTGAADRVRSVLNALDEAGANLRCKDLISRLRDLCFYVRDGRRPGHKVVTHPGLPGLTSLGFTCGHGRNPEIKPVYVRNVARMVRVYQAELTDYLRERP